MCLSHMYAVSHEVECEKINHQIPNEKKSKVKKALNDIKNKLTTKQIKNQHPPIPKKLWGL